MTTSVNDLTVSQVRALYEELAFKSRAVERTFNHVALCGRHLNRELERGITDGKLIAEIRPADFFTDEFEKCAVCDAQALYHKSYWPMEESNKDWDARRTQYLQSKEGVRAK